MLLNKLGKKGDTEAGNTLFKVAFILLIIAVMYLAVKAVLGILK